MGASEPNDAVNRKEIRCIVQVRDQIEFMAELAGDVFRGAVGIACGGALSGALLEGLLRGQAGDVNFMRILVAQFVQTELATIGDLLRARDGVRVAGELADHFFWRL